MRPEKLGFLMLTRFLGVDAVNQNRRGLHGKHYTGGIIMLRLACLDLTWNKFIDMTSVVYRKWLDILSPLFSLFPLRPPWFDPFQLFPRTLHFRHYLLDRRRPDEGSGCFVPRLEELLNGLL